MLVAVCVVSQLVVFGSKWFTFESKQPPFIKLNFRNIADLMDGRPANVIAIYVS